MDENSKSTLGNNMGETQGETPVTPVYTNPNPIAETPAVPVAPVQEPTVPVTPVQEPAISVTQVQEPTAPVTPTQEPANNTNFAYENTVNYQPNYTAPVQNPEDGFDKTPMEMKDWVPTILAFFIPCCGNIILYCIWAFGKKGNINRRNFCRAALIFMAIGTVFYLLMSVVYSGFFMAMLDSMGYYY